jgi:hypothetical protein
MNITQVLMVMIWIHTHANAVYVASEYVFIE